MFATQPVYNAGRAAHALHSTNKDVRSISLQFARVGKTLINELAVLLSQL